MYISEVDVNQRRMKLSLQPRLTFEEPRIPTSRASQILKLRCKELRIGGKHEGIVVDTSHLGLPLGLAFRL